MNKKVIFSLIIIIIVGAAIIFCPKNTDKTVTNLSIKVPDNMDAYNAAMNAYIFDGEPNPASTWPFVDKIIVATATTDVIRASAQLAADQLETQGGRIASHIEYFKIVDGVAYVVLEMQRDGWAGVSVSIAKIQPLVEKTLLQFSNITSVKFHEAPGDARNVIN
jgi:hypothetical protein